MIGYFKQLAITMLNYQWFQCCIALKVTMPHGSSQLGRTFLWQTLAWKRSGTQSCDSLKASSAVPMQQFILRTYCFVEFLIWYSWHWIIEHMGIQLSLKTFKQSTYIFSSHPSLGKGSSKEGKRHWPVGASTTRWSWFHWFYQLHPRIQYALAK
jgi:hypothetical protein